MMKKLILLVSISIVFSNLYGQDTTSFKRFGLGIQLKQSDFVLTETESNIFEFNNLILTYNVSPKFRIESELGAFINLIDADLNIKSYGFSTGLNIYFMKQKEKSAFYYGIKSSYARCWLERNYYDNETIKQVQYSGGPYLGAEYFLGKHFSITGEVGFQYSYMYRRDFYYYTDTPEEHMLLLNNNILLRYYF